mmetsp:Transcript_9337/g.22902  ORF Transcript_9337/g.22902 Transcript_9337/m.22902 type:complete len:230 (+) Transcript_9337:204-893(+)
MPPGPPPVGWKGPGGPPPQGMSPAMAYQYQQQLNYHNQQARAGVQMIAPGYPGGVVYPGHGMQYPYPHQHVPAAAQKSPRARQTAPQTPAAGGSKTAPQAAEALRPRAGAFPSASTAAAAGAAETVAPTGLADLEVLKAIGEILHTLEEGRAVEADAVSAKVEELQQQFARTKESLEAMDGAEMSEKMQGEMADSYDTRLKQLRGMIDVYSELPLFTGLPPSTDCQSLG